MEDPDLHKARKPCRKCGQVKSLAKYYRSKKSKDGRSSTCKECDLIYNKARKKRFREEAMDAYGHKCECCGEARYEFLTFDHIDGLGSLERRRNSVNMTANLPKHLKSLGYPKGKFRLLCHNCNSSIAYYGYCPHKGK